MNELDNILMELAKRYEEKEIQVIKEYWDTIRYTRRTCKVSKNIMRKEMEYWSKYDVESVIEALKIHIRDYPTHREQYTRGIIRNIKRQGNSSKRQQHYSAPSKFVNYKQRDWDFDELEKRERELLQKEVQSWKSEKKEG